MDTSTAGIRAAALKKHEGKTLSQDEQRNLDRALSQSGSESQALGRIIATGKPWTATGTISANGYGRGD